MRPSSKGQQTMLTAPDTREYVRWSELRRFPLSRNVEALVGRTPAVASNRGEGSHELGGIEIDPSGEQIKF